MGRGENLFEREVLCKLSFSADFLSDAADFFSQAALTAT